MLSAINGVSFRPVTPVSPIRLSSAQAPEEESNRPASSKSAASPSASGSLPELSEKAKFAPLLERPAAHVHSESSPENAAGPAEAETKEKPGTTDVSEKSSSPAEPTDEKSDKEPAGEMRNKGTDGEPLSDQELTQLRSLEQRDSEVRRHEQAHLAASGGYARGGASFEYTTGPDGKRYATGGEVNIDSSKANTPEKTIQKMRTVLRAALAPANPSAQDRRVAASARQKQNQAMQEAQAARLNEAEAQKEAAVQNQEGGSAPSESAAPGESSQGSPTSPTLPDIQTAARQLQARSAYRSAS